MAHLSMYICCLLAVINVCAVPMQGTKAQKCPAASRTQVQDPRLHRISEAEVQLLQRPHVTSLSIFRFLSLQRDICIHRCACMCTKLFQCTHSPKPLFAFIVKEYTAKYFWRYIIVIRVYGSNVYLSRYAGVSGVCVCLCNVINRLFWLLWSLICTKFKCYY